MEANNKLLDLSKFEKLNKIGEGGFSKVFCVKEISSGELCAAKEMLTEINEETINTEDFYLLSREVNLMLSLNHPAILEFVGFSLYNFRHKPFPTLITKLAQNGSLRGIINSEISGFAPQGWDFTRKLINIYGIASGLAYLHNHDIIHRDMKPENILMDDYLFPKIADFGLSKITAHVSNSINLQSHKGFKGTPIYMAPEIFREEQITSSVDVYSFSIIVYELLTGITPYQNLSIQQIMMKVCINNHRPELTSDIPLAYQNLISKCWEINPEDRPTFDEIINQLKTNKAFITDSIDEDEYYNYIDFIDDYKTSFDMSHIIHFEEILNKKGKTTTITKVTIQEPLQKVVEQEISQKVVDKKAKSEKSQNLFDEYDIIDDLEDIKKKRKNKKENDIERVKKSEHKIHTKKVEESTPKIQTKKMEESTRKIEFPRNSLEYMVSTGFENVFIEDDKYYIDDDDDEDDDDDFLEFFDDPSVVRHVRVVSNSTGEKALCAIINPDFLKDNSSGLTFDQKTRQLSIIKDVFAMKNLDCPFIVKFLGVNLQNPNIHFEGDEEESNSIMPNPTLFYEYPKNRSLRDVIENDVCLTPAQRQIIMLGIAEGLYYLKNKRVVHGCLCPKAIWLDENFHPKIFKMNNVIYNKVVCNILYQAPEVLNNDGEITEKADAFSFGRLMYYLITGSEPFKLKGDKLRRASSFRLLQSIRDGAIPLIPDYVPDELRNLLERCWEYDPYERPQIKYILYSLILTKNCCIKGIKKSNDIRRINNFIDEIDHFNDRYKDFELVIECNYEANIEINQDDTVECNKDDAVECNKDDTVEAMFYMINKAIYSKFTSYSEEKTLKLLAEMAKKECIQHESKLLLKVIDYVNNLSYKGQELAKKFIEIVFGNLISDLNDSTNLKLLEAVNIEDSIISIKESLFSGFNILARVKIPNSVTVIECNAFSDCNNLEFVYIPDSVETIGKGAFKNCPKLMCIKLPFDLERIDDETFQGDESLSKIVLNNELKAIGKSAFYGCNSIQHIKIPDSVTVIECNAFSDCNNLEFVSIPDSVETIGKGAFKNCPKLVSIKLPSYLKIIDDETFQGDESLSDIVFNDKLEVIGKSAFLGCKSIQKLHIPKSVKLFDEKAFHKCDIKTIFFNGEKPTLKEKSVHWRTSFSKV